MIEQEYAGDVDELSLFWWDSGTGYDGGDVLFPDTGYEWLPKMLVRGLDVRLGSIVRRVEWGSTGVHVVTTRGDLSAADAVVTVPLGALKAGDIEFAPPLPAAKVHAMSGLGMGVLDRLWLRFPRVFWDADADLLGYVSPIKGRWAEWYSLARLTGEPILLGFNAAAYACEARDALGRGCRRRRDDRAAHDLRLTRTGYALGAGGQSGVGTTIVGMSGGGPSATAIFEKPWKSPIPSVSSTT